MKAETIDQYISLYDLDKQQMLQQVRNTISNALPQATEKISWAMPTYYDKHNIIHFAGFKKHIGIYPGSKAIEHFSSKLENLNLKHSKGAIQIPYGDNLHLDLISEIAIWCASTNNHA